MSSSLTTHQVIVTWLVIFATLYIGNADILGDGIVDLTADLLNIGLDGECLLCGENPKNCRAVPTFSYCFSKGVLTSPQLLDMFDLSQMTPKEEEDALFILAGQTLAEKGDEKPSEDSNVTTRYISSCVHSLSLPLMVRLYSVPVAKFLQNKGILNLGNACEYANRYIEAMKASGDHINDMECDHRAKSVALGVGYEYFHTSLGLFTPANAFQMALTFGNDLLELPPALKGSPLLAPKIDVNSGSSPSRSLKCKTPTSSFNETFCKFNPPAVQEFVNTYVEAVSNSDLLNNTYDLQKLSGPQFSSAMFYITCRCFAKIVAHNPVQSAQGIEKALSGYDSIPPPKALAKAWASTIIKYIVQKIKVSTKTANKLAKEYVKLSEKRFEIIVDNSNPVTNLIALITAGRDFMKQHGVFTAADGPESALFFSMALACAEEDC